MFNNIYIFFLLKVFFIFIYRDIIVRIDNLYELVTLGC